MQILNPWPIRVRIRRVKGWRKPVGAVYVTHRNPFYTGPGDDRATAVQRYRDWIDGDGPEEVWLKDWCYRRPGRADIVAALRGKTLCCYCPPDQPCRADVLLEIANQENPREN